MASNPLMGKIEMEILHVLKAFVGSNQLGGITKEKSSVGC